MSVMDIYSRSFMATGVIQNHGVHDLHDQSLIAGWCHLPVRKSFAHRWVEYSKHQMTRGFVRNHSAKNFISNGTVNHHKLPVGVCSSQIDNYVFWKNVARSELLLMHIAKHRRDDLRKTKSVSIGSLMNKELNLNNQLYHHRQNFLQAQHFARTKKGLLLNLSSHIAWRQFNHGMPDSSIDRKRSTRYLHRAIKRFDSRCTPPFSFSDNDNTERSFVKLVEYVRLVVIEFVIPEMLKGNNYPAVQFLICFPDSSKSIYLRKPEPHRIAV